MTDSTTNGPKLLWTPPRLDAWMAENKGQQRYLIEGMLPADSKVLISGKAKRAYKSWWTFSLAMTLASGKQVGTLKPVESKQLPVLILAAEGGRAQTNDRWVFLENGLGVKLKELPIYFSHRENIILDAAAWQKNVKDFVKSTDTKLVIIDPIVMFTRGDENKVQDMSHLMRAIRDISEQGATVAFVHHLAKTSKERAGMHPDEEIRGSSAISGFYDQHHAFRQKTDRQKHNDLTIISKDDEEKYYRINWEISKDMASAKFKLAQSSEPGEIPDEMASDLAAKLREGETYSISDLQSLWGMGEECKTIAAAMVRSHALVKNKRSYMLPA